MANGLFQRSQVNAPGLGHVPGVFANGHVQHSLGQRPKIDYIGWFFGQRPYLICVDPKDVEYGRWPNGLLVGWVPGALPSSYHTSIPDQGER